MVYLDEQSIQQLIEAFNRREFGPAAKLFADDVVLHCPGRSRISGEYHGKTGLVEFWQKQIEITDGTLEADTIAISQGDGILVLVMKISAQLGNQATSWRRVNHYRTIDGRVVEGWIYESDQYTADAVFA